MKKKLFLSTIFCFSFSTFAYAEAPKPKDIIPQAQFDDAKIWLARACVAEEGWSDYGGCTAVSYVYMRRWKAYQRRNISFTNVIRGHAAALRPERTKLSDRQKMIRGLPETATTEKAKEVFAKTLEHVEEWYQGMHPDPCRGGPTDFGGSHDGVPAWWERAVCSEGHNRFWIPRARPIAVAPLQPNAHGQIDVAEMRKRIAAQQRRTQQPSPPPGVPVPESK